MDKLTAAYSQCSVVTSKWINDMTTEQIVETLERARINSGDSTAGRAASASASALGAIGEDYIESILQKRYTSVKRTSAEAHSGDMAFDEQILVEVKNYKSTVPSKEVDKFHRDIRSNML